MAKYPSLVGGVHVDHGPPGTPSKATLAVDRGLKSGKVDVIELDERDLLRLIETAAAALRILARP